MTSAGSLPWFPQFLACALLLVALPQARGTVNIEVSAYQLNDAGGSATPTSTLALLVVDTAGDGLDPAVAGSLAVNAFLDSPTGDDVILFRTNLSAFSIPGALQFSATGLDLATVPGWEAGDALHLVWFPGLTIADLVLASGQAYGRISLGATPTDGSTASFTYVTSTDSTFYDPILVPTLSPATAASETSVLTLGPEIVVTGNGTNIADGNTPPATGNHTDFGTTTVLGAGVVRTFTVTNSGTATLTVQAPVLSGATAADFEVILAPTSPVTLGGGTTTFQIRFIPSVSGVRAATITFGNNDGDENPFTFDIAGTGANSAPTDLGLSPAVITENNLPGAAVGTLSATDADAGDTHGFALVTGAGADDNGAFTIDGSTLRIVGVANFEAKPSYSIRVRATDSGNPAQTFDNPLTVTVTNVNEAPTNVLLSQSSVPENSPASTVVGTLSAADPDAGATYSFDLVTGTGDTNNGLFAVVGNELRLTGAADFETDPTLSVRLRATDTGDSGLTFTNAFTITVTNVNEAPTSLALAPSSITENNPAGATVGTFTATDPDANPVFIYSLVNGTGDTDNGSFTIVGNALRLTGVADFETKDSYSIRVQVADGLPGLTWEEVFTVTVTDVNQPDIVVRGNGTEITDGVLTPSLTNHTDFGSTAVVGGTVTRIFEITNSGDVALSLTGTAPNFVILSGPGAAAFAVTVQPTVASIAANEGTATFAVTFNPAAVGPFSATVSLANNDSSKDPFDFVIQGSGTNSPSDPKSLALTVGDDGSVTVSGAGGAVINPLADEDGTSPTYDVVSGTVLSLVPTANVGFEFVRWLVDGAGSIANPLAVTMDANVAVSAEFAAVANTTGPANGFSDAEVAALEAFLSQLRVGDTVNLSLPVTLAPGTRLVVTGLPAGLTFNAATRSITGTVLAELGDGAVSVQIRTVATNAVVESISLRFVVLPFLFAGAYEAIIENASNVPVGRVRLTVTSPTSASAVLELVNEKGLARTISGTRITFGALSGGVLPANLSFPALPAPSSVAATTAVMNLGGLGVSDLVTGTQGLTNTLRGFRLVRPGRSPVQPVTVAFENGTPGDRLLTPGGSGFGTGAVNSSGVLPLKGFLGDGQSYTTTLRLSETNQAVVWMQPYTNKTESFFGGIINVGSLVVPGRGGPSPSTPITNGLRWAKSVRAAEKSYPGGFGVAPTVPLAVDGFVSKWFAVGTVQGLANTLGLTARNLNATYVAPPVAPQLPVGRALPTQFNLRGAAFSLVRVTPPNSVNWTGNAVPTSGRFGGKPVLVTPLPATVSGVFLQDPQSGAPTKVGVGFMRIPTNRTGSFQTSGIRFDQ